MSILFCFFLSSFIELFSCDLVLSPLNVVKGKRQWVAIELVVHAQEETMDSPKAGSVREHYLRAATKYATIDGVKEVWMINFDTNEDCHCWPTKAQSKSMFLLLPYFFKLFFIEITTAHVSHTLLWDNVKLTFQDKDDQIV
jgi:hypothetical protein